MIIEAQFLRYYDNRRNNRRNVHVLIYKDYKYHNKNINSIRFFKTLAYRKLF